MRDVQIRQVKATLELLQEIEYLRSDRDVEGGDRLVGDDELGVEGKRTRDGDALALATAELVRIAVQTALIQTDRLE